MDYMDLAVCRAPPPPPPLYCVVSPLIIMYTPVAPFTNMV